MSDALAARCEQLRPIVVTLTPAIIEAMGSAQKCQRLLPLLAELEDVVRLGASGIDHPIYLEWLATATGSIDDMRRAATASNPTGVWRAFLDERTGIKRLSDACVGFPGW